MSLRPTVVGPVPKETARVVQAVFPGGHRYVRLANALGAVFTDDLFAGLYVDRGRRRGEVTCRLGRPPPRLPTGCLRPTEFWRPSTPRTAL